MYIKIVCVVILNVQYQNIFLMKREKNSKAYGVKGGRLLREKHARKIHFFRALAKKLVGAVPAESVRS